MTRSGTKHLELNEAALELAKVALTSFVDDTDVVEYLLVAAGTLARNLHVASRQTGRTTLIQRAQEQLGHELEKLKAKVVAKGGDPAATIQTFIENLQRLEVWSGEAFDSHLGVVWSSLQAAIERAFAVHAVLLERPRPDLDETRHLAAFGEEAGLLPQRAGRDNLPPSLRTASAESPTTAPAIQVLGEESLAHDVVISANSGDCVVLQAPGGGGKTKTLELSAHAAAVRRASDPLAPLPILVLLKDYRDGLDALVHRALGVVHGHWTSIPGTFLLLLDGLNEMSPSDAQRLCSELQATQRTGRTAVVITCRDSGLLRPVVLAGITASWSIARFTIHQIRRVATSRLRAGAVPSFMDEVLRRLNTPAGARLFSLPFVVRAAVDAFAATGALPDTLGAIIDDVLHRRYQRNEELDVARGDAEVAELTLRELAGDVAFRLRVLNRQVAATEAEMDKLVHDALIALRERNVFGAGELTDTGARAALIRHELLVRAPSGSFDLRHDLVAGLLAAGRLAEAWRDHLDGIQHPAVTDAWLFAVSRVPEPERLPMAAELAARDPVLAANSAIEAGIEEALAGLLVTREPTAAAGALAMYRWMEALASLGTDACMERLREYRHRPRWGPDPAVTPVPGSRGGDQVVTPVPGSRRSGEVAPGGGAG